MLPKGSTRLRSGTVTVTFHTPLYPADYSEKEELMAAVRSAIESN
jgi:1-acyl-sn-glycerol-3-phosphate acyltransferase